MDFATNPRRDAWPSIRGFTFQLRVTIQRWLDLDDETTLLCECGEDVDVVANAVQNKRLLEQIKIQPAISLRDSVVVASLVRYFELRELNPSHRLSYRFWTTAAASHERNHVFPRGLAGLEAWNAARQGRLTEAEVSQFLAASLKILRGISQPSGIPSELFERFRRWLSAITPNDFHQQWVRSVEWALGSPGVDEAKNDLITVVATRWAGFDRTRAKLMVDRLTVELLEMLGKPGAKKLTAVRLREILSQPHLTPQSQAVVTQLERLESAVSDLTLTADRTLEKVTAIDERVASFGAQLSAAALAMHGGTSLTSALTVQQPPPIPDWAARRQQQVDGILERLKTATACWLRGQPGGGKTLLARLTANHIDRLLVWVSLPQGQPQSLRLLLALASRTGDARDLAIASGLSQEPLDAALRRWLPPETAFLVVVDNVDATSTEVLSFLGALVRHCAASLCLNLVVTSQRRLPNSLLDLSPTGTWTEQEVPPLSEQDVEDVLKNRGLQPVSALARTVHSVTKGHPVLVAATMRYLEQTGLNILEAPVAPLFRGDSLQSARADARRELNRLVPNAEARRLLDRLSLLLTPLERDEIDAVAQVRPPIASPGELLLELKDVWILPVARDRYQVSPLLDGIGRETLSSEDQRATFSASARVLMDKDTADVQQILKILLSLVGAEEWSSLGGFCLHLIKFIDTPKLAKHFEFSSLLFQERWPDNIDTAARLAIRAAQIRIGQLAGRDTLAQEAELLRLSAHQDVSSSHLAIVGLGVAGPFSETASATFAIECVLSMVRNHGAVLKQILPSEFVPESLFWLLLSRLKTLEDVLAWIRAASQLDASQITSLVAEAQRLDDATDVLASMIWRIPMGLPAGQQDWQEAASVVDALISLADRPEASAFRVPAVTSKATILADHLGDIDSAMALVEGAYASSSQRESLLLDHLAGCILFDAGRLQEATVRYRRAVEQPATLGPSAHFDSARRAAEAAGKESDWTTAEAFQRLAVRSGRESGRAELDVLEVAGELAWSQWKLDKHDQAIAIISVLARQLRLHADLQSARYREVFRKVGHSLTWFHAGRMQIAPAGLDGQPIVEPFPGFFTRSRPLMADAPSLILQSRLALLTAYCYRSTHQSVLLQMLAFKRARRLAERECENAVIDLAAGQESALLAGLGRIKDAVIVGLLALRCTAVVNAQRQDGQVEFIGDFRPSWESLTPTAKADAERMLFWQTVCPALAAGLLADDPAGTSTMALKQFREVLNDDSAIEPSYWNRLVDQGIDILGLPFGEKYAFMNSGPANEHALVAMMYFAIAGDPTADMRTVCRVQAALLAGLHSRSETCREATALVAKAIVTYWSTVVAQRSCTLSAPRLLRSALSDNRDVSPRAAAQVLAAAEVSAGTTIPSGIRDALRELAR